MYRNLLSRTAFKMVRTAAKVVAENWKYGIEMRGVVGWKGWGCECE